MIVIVAGMHRSGTSALAGILHQHGILMGEDRTFRPRPSPENPKGYYENIRFRHVSDRILEESGYRVKSWNTTIPTVQAGWLNRFRARRLVKRYSRRYTSWGWKDPRSCLTLGVWLDELERLHLLPRVRLIHITREATSVAQSMVTRGNTTFDSAMALWTIYNRRTLRAIDDTGVTSLFVTFEELCRAPLQTTERVCDFVGKVPDPETVSRFIDETLDRSSSQPVPRQVDEMTADTAAEVTDELRRRRSPSGPS